jgi:23S rRNA (guanosine2251-2'-O)-methyltransferase
MVLVLHNIRSAHNVGSMFRTADGAGVERVILSGYTPGPLGPHKKEKQQFVKVSLGAEHSVPHSRIEHLSEALEQLRADGYTIIAVEKTDTSTSIFEYAPKAGGKLAVVMGNEVEGVEPEALKVADHTLHIPMHGTKESLNVSVACGVALFTLREISSRATSVL